MSVYQNLYYSSRSLASFLLCTDWELIFLTHQVKRKRKGLGAYTRGVVKNGKLLLRFADDKKLALLKTFFFTPKSDRRQLHLDEKCGPLIGPLHYTRRLLWSQPNQTTILFTQQSASQRSALRKRRESTRRLGRRPANSG